MKIKNIFKKETKSSTTSNVEKLEKNQLSKIIGGGDDTLTEAEANVLKTRHETAKNSISNVR